MPVIIIPASRSLTVSTKVEKGNISDGTITVGKDGKDVYISYLYFDTTLIPPNVEIASSKIVLFKKRDFTCDKSEKFFIYPLSDYFSTLTTYEKRPKLKTSMKKVFSPFSEGIDIQAKITSITRKWYSGAIVNKGLVIMSSNKQTLCLFGSADNKDSSLIPFIRVVYRQLPVATKLDEASVNINNQYFSTSSGAPISSTYVIETQKNT